MTRIITSGYLVAILFGFSSSFALAQTSSDQLPVNATMSVPDLIAKGKTQYKSSLYKSALESFEAAVQQAPTSDEALGYAAMTAYRLDLQDKAREYFGRRAALPNQKPTVKAYCNFSIALSNWRDAHDTAVKYGTLTEEKIILSDEKRAIVNERLNDGFDHIVRDASSENAFPETLNIKNLLHAEAALTSKEDNMAAMHRRAALEALRKAIALSKSSGVAKHIDDFISPTFRIAEYNSATDIADPSYATMLKSITGGKPVKKANASFPSYPGGTEVAEGEPNPDIVKVEVLISTTGEVVFARAVTGRPEYTAPAVYAAKRWKFEPASFENYPVQISSVIVFDRRKK